ncbi:MAG: HAD family hydrolase [Prevotellaceae bacterium]|jgi:phosphoglycolate phosphatase|nr:HAD family hydrolase [Prevotellaceae bacterium]
MKKFRAVIFDLDGTLIYSIPDIADSMNKILHEHGFPVYGCEQYRYFLGNGIKRLVETCIPETHRTAENIELLYSRMTEEYMANCTNKTVVYEGIFELLETLQQKGIKLAILSNKADEITQKTCAILLKPVQFDMTVGASDRFPKKPDPAAALYIAGQISVSPDKIFYLGDTSIDMKTAIAAGFFPAGAEWGFRDAKELTASGARFIAKKPDDCLRFF